MAFDRIGTRALPFRVSFSPRSESSPVSLAEARARDQRKHTAMADPHRNNGANGAMAEQKEYSVLFSLKELMSIEENRIREEDDAKKRKGEAEVQAKAES